MRKACTVAMFTIMALAPTAYASSFDAATDFSLASNPNGVWSYGYSISNMPGGPFTPDTINSNMNGNMTFGNSNLSSWQGNVVCVICMQSEKYPLVIKNTANTVQTIGTTVSLLPGELALHPAGPPVSSEEFAVVRFTAPTTGLFTINSTFGGRDTGSTASSRGTTTDVHVLLNNVSLFDGEVTGFGATQSFSTTRLLSFGDTLDFVVGIGDGTPLENGGQPTFFDDTTALSATISTVPEPASLLLLGSGVIGLAWWRRRNNA